MRLRLRWVIWEPIGWVDQLSFQVHFLADMMTKTGFYGLPHFYRHLDTSIRTYLFQLYYLDKLEQRAEPGKLDNDH